MSEMKERMADCLKKEDFEKKQIHKHIFDQASFKNNASWGRYESRVPHLEYTNTSLVCIKGSLFGV